ncbi:family 43 glycosylhydrolase [Chondrinema litorale]|uniref:family 43 glycosylhydrolase n=1 Tax=Chondrinema litorale TaxID=2994555 RepID=UPI002542A22D|nr:family 43 glycosylhydrolase [Chondrinema litorale]UZR97825.1 family 43 glycosylhydrolase [Chondrinema litorale]
MNKNLLLLSFYFLISLLPVVVNAQQNQNQHKAPAPLFRDPIYDGAADPVLVWNREEKKWWMLYTQRRANVDAQDVAFCYGTKIGIACSDDEGKSWYYRGALDLEFERGINTFWAPDVVYHDGTYHMFVSYIKGVRNHWSGLATMAHYTSKNLWDWEFQDLVKLTSDNVIDATLYQMPDGIWKMWFKDSTRGSVTMLAESSDLFNWKFDEKPAIGGKAHEGPKVFHFQDYYWMLTDEWAGMRVYRSKDTQNWEKQGMILTDASARPEDTPSGAHGDVVVLGDKAYVFYFTHPGRETHFEGSLNEHGVLPYPKRRSSIQVAALQFTEGTLKCDRSDDFKFIMSNPEELE